MRKTSSVRDPRTVILMPVPVYNTASYVSVLWPTPQYAPGKEQLHTFMIVCVGVAHKSGTVLI